MILYLILGLSSADGVPCPPDALWDETCDFRPATWPTQKHAEVMTTGACSADWDANKLGGRQCHCMDVSLQSCLHWSGVRESYTCPQYLSWSFCLSIAQRADLTFLSSSFTGLLCILSALTHSRLNPGMCNWSVSFFKYE
jgi:hypothetical protein